VVNKGAVKTLKGGTHQRGELSMLNDALVKMGRVKRVKLKGVAKCQKSKSSGKKQTTRKRKKKMTLNISIKRNGILPPTEKQRGQ